MLEILGRKLKLQDLVIFENRHGIVIGEDTIYTGKHNGIRKPSHVYLVQNPIDEEIKIKQGLIYKYKQDELQKLQDKNRTENEKKTIKNNTKRGDIVHFGYSDYLYLGRASCVDLQGKECLGHIYLPLSYTWNDILYYNSKATISDLCNYIIKIGSKVAYTNIDLSSIKDNIHIDFKVLKSKSSAATSIKGHLDIDNLSELVVYYTLQLCKLDSSHVTVKVDEKKVPWKFTLL